jgi:hypothetical protein
LEAHFGLCLSVDSCVCYTLIMLPSEFWQKWAQSLQRIHLSGLAVTLLEGAAPIRTLLSQTLFSLTPFFNSTQRDSLSAFAETLDDSQKCLGFATYLRNGSLNEQR